MKSFKAISKKLDLIDCLLNNLDDVMRSYQVSDETFGNAQYRRLDREYYKLMDKRKYWLDRLPKEDDNG